MAINKVREWAEDLEFAIILKPKNRIGTLEVAEDKIREMVNAEGLKDKISVSFGINNFIDK
ncbi:MAG: hypothetical protein GY707_12725 [Desulfobacteraceae bacterium]|nr:hypothetical protein [Desulfobacteraceae bacterium]